MSEIATKVRSFLATDLGLDISNVTNDTPLFTSGMIDSFALIELLSYLEGEFKCKIDISDLGIDNLDTLDAITRLVGENQ